MVTVATGNDNVRLAVDYAIAKATGGKIPTADSSRARSSRTRPASRKPVDCQSGLPGDVYLSAQMPGAQQAALSK